MSKLDLNIFFFVGLKGVSYVGVCDEFIINFFNKFLYIDTFFYVIYKLKKSELIKCDVLNLKIELNALLLINKVRGSNF